MNIYDAARQAFIQDKCITRTHPSEVAIFKVKMTDTDDCCKIIFRDETYPRWNPALDDFLATDWEVVD